MDEIVIDTHILIWMLTEPSKLSMDAVLALKQAENSNSKIYVSSISLVEIRYLIEKGKFAGKLFEQIEALLTDPNEILSLCPLALEEAKAVERIDRSVTPDMPDRIIAATAFSLGLPLISADHKIQALSSIKVIW